MTALRSPGAARCRAPRSPIEPPRLSADPADLDSLASDAAHVTGRSDAVAFPETEGQWSWLLASGRPVLAVGAQSSLTGGATPRGGIVATTARQARILGEGDRSLRVEAGLSVADLQRAAAAKGLFHAPAPTHDGASIGGTVATNAAGARTFKYGTTRRWIRGLTVVLAGGDVLDLSRGDCRASPDGWFEIVRATGETLRVPAPNHVLPRVPKCSAGYHSEPGMDLVDLFVGAEGTLGVVTEVEVELLPRDFVECAVLALLPSADDGYALVRALRAQSERTREEGSRAGIDASAIEHLDRRTLEILREDGAATRLGVPLRPDHDLALLVILELPAGTTAAGAEEQLTSYADPAAVAPLARFARLLEGAGGLDAALVAWPGDRAAMERLAAFREAAPECVNARIGRLRRADPAVRKVGGDVIAPFDRFEELVALCRDVPGRLGLDVAVWGHASDGNLHPNVIPRTEAEVIRGQEAQLEIGRAVIRLGGSPMAEHGVGRHPIKQQLLAEMVGAEGLARMKATRGALDPGGILAPGVLFD